MTHNDAILFIERACSFLGIEIKKKEKEFFSYTIPSSLFSFFNEHEIAFSPQDLTYESPFLRTLTELVQKKTRGISYGEIDRSFYKETLPTSTQGPYLIVWFSHTLYGPELTRYVKGYSYSFLTKDVSPLPFHCSFLSHIREKKEKKISSSSFQEALTACEETAMNRHTLYMKAKQLQYNSWLFNETLRIHSYYDHLERENHPAESSSQSDPLSYVDALNERHLEKRHLLDQQREKFTVTKHSLKTEPSVFLYLDVL